MRTFNVRLAAILLAIMVVFSGGVYFLHRYQVHRNAGMFKAAAERAEKQAADAAKKKDASGERQANAEVIKCLDWYRQLMPDDVEATEKLGLMLAKQAYEGKERPDLQ